MNILKKSDVFNLIVLYNKINSAAYTFVDSYSNQSTGSGVPATASFSGASMDFVLFGDGATNTQYIGFGPVVVGNPTIFSSSLSQTITNQLIANTSIVKGLDCSASPDAVIETIRARHMVIKFFIVLIKIKILKIDLQRKWHCPSAMSWYLQLVDLC